MEVRKYVVYIIVFAVVMIVITLLFDNKREKEEFIASSDYSDNLITNKTVNETYSEDFIPCSTEISINQIDGICDFTSERYKSHTKGENYCRCALEKHFQLEFPNVRPDFLIPLDENGKKKPKKYGLELDCYNECLGLAVEYNGKQHYERCDFFGQTDESFKKQQDNDELKKKLCKEHGVTLIVVPYTVPYEKIESYILERLPATDISSCKFNY